MAHLIQNIIIFSILFPLSLIGTTISQTQSTTTHKNLAIYHTVVGDIEKKYNFLVEKKLRNIGFRVTDPHKRVNDQYKVKWGSSILDVLSFSPIVNDATIIPLLNIDPRIAGFAPFNLVLHKKLDDNVSYVGHLVPEVMLDILGIENTEVRSKFTSTFKALDDTIAQELGGHKKIIPYKKLPKQRMIHFEYNFEAPEDMDDFIAEFQNKFELSFINKGYLIAGFHDFMEATDDAEDVLSSYDAFWTYSLCHLEFSYNVFDNEGARPEAGLFAPCTMYMYIKKGTNTIVVGMFRLQNWADTLDIQDPKRLGLIQRLDTEIPQILTKFGMHTTDPKLPTSTMPTTNKHKKMKSSKDSTHNTISHNIQKIKVGDTVLNISIPKVPTVTKCATSYSADNDRSIKFSKRTPPNYKPHSFERKKKEKVSANTRIGEVNKGKVSAYLRADYMNVDTVEKTLKSAGFDIIASTPINKDGSLISIIFTDTSLTAHASKPNRGFIGSLRVLVDTKEKMISITNPLYMSKGFLQEDFDEKEAKRILSKIITHFENLKNSQDALKFQLLANYQFMKGMPKYQNMIEIASGENLLKQIKNNKRVLFTQKLSNDATLIGVSLSKRTNNFIKRIGRNNAAMLPYPILIQDGKAKILDPKFYISFMYPKLTMSEFMTIATVPDAMIKDCERVFQKKK